MSSGIYKLTFSDSSFYIGKSNDIERRWNQHSKNLLDGKHAVKLQLAYNKCGDPEYSVMIFCHEDHLDTLEGILINAHWSNNILNTTRPKIISEYEWEQLQNIPVDMWMNGPIHNMNEIINLRNHVTELIDDLGEAEEAFEESLAEIKNGTRLESLEAEIKILDRMYQHALNDRRAVEKEFEAYKSRGFIARLFNF